MKKYTIYVKSRYEYGHDKEKALGIIKQYLEQGFDVSISEEELIENDN